MLFSICEVFDEIYIFFDQCTVTDVTLSISRSSCFWNFTLKKVLTLQSLITK